MLDKIRLTVGFDQREAVAFHTFSQSVLEKSSLPVQIMPLARQSLKGYVEAHTDGSNDFIYSRFLTPYLHGFEGWTIYADGDMVCLADLAELWSLRDESKAVLVVKHDYQTVSRIKYFGNCNEDYPRKNWSSLVLWNCAHPANRVLTADFVSRQSGAFLHRFSWLDDVQIGELPAVWNWLATEYPDNPQAKIVHFTLGTPCLNDYAKAPMSDLWHTSHSRSQQGLGG